LRNGERCIAFIVLRTFYDIFEAGRNGDGRERFTSLDLSKFVGFL
jgi:hypothetical protein